MDALPPQSTSPDIAIYSSHDTGPTEKDVPYLSAGRTEKMDAWLPPDSFLRPVPAVLLIHGGGWAIGDKADARETNIAQNLTAAGIAVFSINYHLKQKASTAEGSEKPASAWPQNFEDCWTAYHFLRKESARFGIDPKCIATMGGSAGGHLAMLVGMTAEEGSRVACIVDLYGIPDVGRFSPHDFAGATPQETQENLQKASPITYLGADTPPILVLQGDADKIVPAALSREFVVLLKAKGIPHEYVEIPGAPHTFDLQSTGTDLAPLVIAFLKKHFAACAKATGL